MMDADQTSDEVPSTPLSPPKVVNMEDNNPHPRLMITKMELENFKSYAGVREIGPFHKCFSSVVGPNGSGKSNVIDALLFVFGKRAKKLRLNKVSELIHKSAAVSDAQTARVSVYFQEIIDTGDGDFDFEVVPGSECVITRLARKDNSSSYKLNGRNVQFKEIATFLGAKGIDLDNNRFLILQGEVEMISMMPPKGKTENDEGLLEYLEDIIGSNKYVEETIEVAEEFEKISEVRQEKLNRVKVVEKEKKGLESAKVEAEALLGKEREIRRKQNILYQIHAMNTEKQKEAYLKQMTQAKQRLDQEREKLNKATARIDEIQQGIKAQQREYDVIHAELKKTKDEFAAYERQDVQLGEEIKHAKAQAKKLQAKILAETKKEQDAIAKKAAAEESIPMLESKIQELIDVKAEEDAKLEVIREEMKGVTHKLRIELEAKTQELAPVQQEKAIFQNNLETAQTEVKLLEDATTRAKDKLKAAEEELASIDQKQESKRSELAACEDELAQAKARIIEAEQEDKATIEKEAKLASKSKTLLARAEEAKAALQSKGVARSTAVKGILKASERGGELSKVGILGRLGDLATIPEEYDVAVSTACGMLDHIVVQTTAGAQKCLEFLRKYSLGRANFIPLDKLKKGAHDQAVQTPEDAPRLFELIAPSNFAISPAIFLAIGNTLVAPDLETATRWAYDYGKRWRVVTMDGKLIETAGTMAGGGKSVRRGGMKLASSARASQAASLEEDEETQDCERLEQESSKCHALLQECRKLRKELAEEIRNLKKQVKALEIKIPKLALEIEGCDTTRAELTKIIPELRSQSDLSKEDARKLAALNQKVSMCKSDMASCSMQASKLEADVHRLQKAILDAGGPKMKKQQATCDKILAELNNAEKSLNSAKVAVTASDKAGSKAKDAKASAEEELEQCQTMLEAKKAQRKALDEDAFKVMQAFEDVKQVEAEKRAALESVTKEVEELQNAQSEVKSFEIELLAKIDSCGKDIADCDAKISHWTSEIEKIRVQAKEDDDDFDDEAERTRLVDAFDQTYTVPMEIETTPEESDGDDVEMTNDTEADAVVKSSKNSLPTLTFETLEKYSKEELQREIGILENERNKIARNANMGAIAEYRRKEADYLERVSELSTVNEQRNSIRNKYDELRRLRLEMFMDGFNQITLKLKEMYQMITLGGDAELELVDSLDPFSEGIVFSVRPPKKSWKNISNLSGGEKTLSSLALVFALHHFKPTPLYVMDEIDAALDFKNVSIVANYIKDRTKNAQFIIISLRNNMFELADRLVGIYKTNNCTKSVTIDPRAFGIDGQQNGFLPTTPALKEKTNANGLSTGKERRRLSVSSENIVA